MNIAELLGKVLKMSNHRRNSLAGHSHSYTNSHLGSACPPNMSNINRPLSNSRATLDSFGGRSGRGRRLMSLERALLDDDDLFFDFRCDGGGIHIHGDTGIGGQDPDHNNNTPPRTGDIDSPHPSPHTTNESAEPESTPTEGPQQPPPQQQHVGIASEAKPARPPPVYRKDSALSGTGTMSSCISEPTDNWTNDTGSQSRDSMAIF